MFAVRCGYSFSNQQPISGVGKEGGCTRRDKNLSQNKQIAFCGGNVQVH